MLVVGEVGGHMHVMPSLGALQTRSSQKRPNRREHDKQQTSELSLPGCMDKG